MSISSGCRCAAKLLVLLAACAFFFQMLSHAAGAGASPARRIDFNRDIRPILSDKCWVCHGPDAPNRKIKLRLDSEAAAKAELGRSRRAIVPGHPEQSQLVKRITAADEAMRMPPADSGRQLTAQEIELLQEWIRQGAEWQRHWSFITPDRSAPPEVKNKQWPRNAIDYFVLARLEREGLQPATEADRATLIRRVALDLTGPPPTPREVDDFLKDKSAQAYERVVDRLLSSPRYGERMAFRWLDAARYADTNGYQYDGERQMWRWRDWVIGAFNRNLPFDQFTIEQLAGDLLPHARTPAATLEQKIATGFNRNHRGNSEDGVIPEEYAVEYVIDRVDTTATVWLGLTMGCARCHNHKYDPVTQQEFYQLFAYFNSIPENGRAQRVGNSPPFIAAPSREQQRELRALMARFAVAEKDFAGHDARLRPAMRAWERRLAAAEPQHWFPRDDLAAHFALDAADSRFRAGTPQPRPGRVNQAIEFDGQVFLDAGQVAQFEYENRFTLAAWIKPASENAGAIITRAKDADAEKSAGARMGTGYGLLLEDGRLQFNVMRTWADDGIRIETENKLAAGEWHHVLATYDGSRLAEGVRVYVDGQPRKLRVNFDHLLRPFEIKEPLRIGAVGGASSEQRFRGLIDEVRVYSAVLSPPQIAQLACADALGEIARTAVSRRTEARRDKLSQAFLELAAPRDIQQSWRRLASLQRERAKLEAAFPTVMVMQEAPEQTFERYGPDARKPGTYAANCILARRLAERGVRFIQLFHRGWDQHSNCPQQIRNQCRDTDQPSAALIEDLRERGLLDDTLVVWGGEFGRTVYSQGKLTETNYGRDHHPRCFTVWLAGGGVKAGIGIGETDDYSYNLDP